MKSYIGQHDRDSMKINLHCEQDGVPNVSWSDDGVLDNRSEPVVRQGGATKESK